MEKLEAFISDTSLTAHGFCLLWRPGLIWLHVLSDALITLAYFSIPIALLVFIARRKDLAFNWIFALFALFIFSCGATHIMDIWTLWYPDYYLQGFIKAITALVSLGTAIALWPLIPKALMLPSPTALRQANEKLEREIAERVQTEEMLRQSQKMELIGQLTGGIAHDFNNLLTIIIGSVERLQRHMPADSPNLKAADLAMEGALRAAALTQRLLAYSRRQALKPQPIKPNTLIHDMHELMQRTLGESITIKTLIADDTWQIFADEAQLQSVLLNLAINARDAMPNGGMLLIATENKDLDQLYSGANDDVVAGQYVTITVSDTGIGMSSEVAEKAFEPFFTTKEIGQGTGLGLSQVYGFIKQSGGHVKIYSELGQGTSVKLYLPRLLSEAAAASKPMQTGNMLVSADHQTVLVVEDDDGVRANSVEILGELGYQVLQAADGPSALKILEANANIQLLFTDIGLPGGMNGCDLANIVRRYYPAIKIVFTSGYAQNILAHQGYLTSDVTLLLKPFTYAELGRVLQKALSEPA